MNKIFSILLIRNEARLVAAPDWETAIRAASIYWVIHRDSCGDDLMIDEIPDYMRVNPKEHYPPHHCVYCLYSDGGKKNYCERSRPIPHYWQDIPEWEPTVGA